MNFQALIHSVENHYGQSESHFYDQQFLMTLAIFSLENQLKSGNISEVILATSSTIHGEATALFISEICKKYKIQSTRIAYGIPIGGELDLVDGRTLIHAFSGRKTY